MDFKNQLFLVKKQGWLLRPPSGGETASLALLLSGTAAPEAHKSLIALISEFKMLAILQFVIIVHV
jgi:hypothetical protein